MRRNISQKCRYQGAHLHFKDDYDVMISADGDSDCKLAKKFPPLFSVHIVL
jgi:hypothetical protein